MIWIVLIILVLCLALYLAPVFIGPAQTEADGDVKAYFDQIDILNAQTDMAAPEQRAAIRRLERQILDRQSQTGSQGAPRLFIGLMVIIVIVCAGLYAALGRPDFDRLSAASQVADQGRVTFNETDDMADLIAAVEQRLATDRQDDPHGWMIYARALAAQGRMDEALRAYERWIALAPDAEMARIERDRLIAQRNGGNTSSPGPSAADIDAASRMSEDERAVMINAMVDGLAARLAETPDDPAGWTRLIRARLVLGQDQQAEADVIMIRQMFSNETADEILRDAGWTD